MPMQAGYLQVYTGDGKGKTTAALGLALRAVGRGLKVVFFQFLKGTPSGELTGALRLGGDLRIIRLAETEKFVGAMSEGEKALLGKSLGEELGQVRTVIEKELCDIIVLDEIMAVIHAGLLTVGEVCALIDSRPPGMEMVLTGRAAPRVIIDRADLVTEMRPVKHYMDAGVRARRGIEK